MRDGVAEKATFSVNYHNKAISGNYSLYLNEQEPRMTVHCNSSTLDIGAVLARLEISDKTVLSFENVSSDFVSKGITLGKIVQNLEFKLRSKGGVYDYHDPDTGGVVSVKISDAVMAGKPGEKVTMDIQGNIGDHPVAMYFEIEDKRGKDVEKGAKYKVKNRISLANTVLELEGMTTLPYIGKGISLKGSLKGDRLNTINSLVHLNLPPIGPYHLTGQFNIVSEGYRLNDLTLKVGSSLLNGDAAFNTKVSPLGLDIALKASRVQLDDLKGIWPEKTNEAASEEKEAAEKKEEVSAIEELLYYIDQSLLDKYSGRFSLEVEEVVSGEEFFGKGVFGIEQQEGEIRFHPFQVQLPTGTIDIDLSLKPAVEARKYSIDIDIDGVDYGFVGRWLKDTANTSGILDMRASIVSESRSYKNIIENGSGSVSAVIQPANSQAWVVDLWAVNFIKYLIQIILDGENSTLNCLAGRFNLHKGILSQEDILIDTTRVQVKGDLTVNFNTRRITGKLSPYPKKPQFLNLATPVVIDGKISDFNVGLDPKDMVGTLVKMGVSPLTSLVKMIMDKSIPEDDTAGCLQLMNTGKE